MTKAKQITIQLGSIPLNVYQMADGSYQLYAESVTGAVNKPSSDLAQFLHGESPQALAFRKYSLVETEAVQVEGGGFIKPIPKFLATYIGFLKPAKATKKPRFLFKLV